MHLHDSEEGVSEEQEEPQQQQEEEEEEADDVQIIESASLLLPEFARAQALLGTTAPTARSRPQVAHSMPQISEITDSFLNQASPASSNPMEPPARPSHPPPANRAGLESHPSAPAPISAPAMQTTSSHHHRAPSVPSDPGQAAAGSGCSTGASAAEARPSGRAPAATTLAALHEEVAVLRARKMERERGSRASSSSAGTCSASDFAGAAGAAAAPMPSTPSAGAAGPSAAPTMLARSMRRATGAHALHLPPSVAEERSSAGSGTYPPPPARPEGHTATATPHTLPHQLAAASSSSVSAAALAGLLYVSNAGGSSMALHVLPHAAPPSTDSGPASSTSHAEELLKLEGGRSAAGHGSGRSSSAMSQNLDSARFLSDVRLGAHATMSAPGPAATCMGPAVSGAQHSQPQPGLAAAIEESLCGATGTAAAGAPASAGMGGRAPGTHSSCGEPTGGSSGALGTGPLVAAPSGGSAAELAPPSGPSAEPSFAADVEAHSAAILASLRGPPATSSFSLSQVRLLGCMGGKECYAAGLCWSGRAACA